jgi:hypothetical protein
MSSLGTICLLLLGAQAEPAPGGAPPTAAPAAPVEESPPPASPRLRIGIGLGMAWRPGSNAAAAPALGGSLHMALSYRYLTFGGQGELATGFQFNHERYSRCDALGDAVGSGDGSCLSDPYVRHGDFLALQTLAFRLARWRPQVSLAAGFSLAERVPTGPTSPEVRATRLALRGSLGVARQILSEMELALELAHTSLVRSPRATVGGQELPIFIGRQTLALWVVYVPKLDD